MSTTANQRERSFNVGSIDGVSWKYCSTIHKADGYTYQEGEEAHSSKGYNLWFPAPNLL